MGNLQHITRFEVFVNQYGWMDGLTQHKRFSGGNRECVRRSLPETRQYCRLWKYCWWIRRKNPRLNRSTERSRRSPPYTAFLLDFAQLLLLKAVIALGAVWPKTYLLFLFPSSFLETRIRSFDKEIKYCISASSSLSESLSKPGILFRAP